MNFARVLGAVLWVGAFWAPTLVTSGVAETTTPPAEAKTASVVFLGEQHDNAAHHALQADWVAELKPSAIVFEMLTSEQAERILPEHLQDAEVLEDILKWEKSGWPEFAMYYPIFDAAPNVRFYGAGVPSDRVRGLMGKELAEVAGDLTEPFGLDAPLPEDEQAEREALQMAAHCDALPASMLPTMVDVQRLRDAALAASAIQALDDSGGPVVVITGNGHAREDWGAPFLLRRAAPELEVFALGQGEAGNIPDGGFGITVDGPAVDRGDPCDAFR